MSDSPSNENPHPSQTEIQDPPRTLGATLLKLGPGMIIAGSIVGSGELIATTKAGAEAGFWLLWLILIGCVIKVFTQVEIGRYAVAHSETALAALNKVPGPRLRANWIIWFWALVMCAVLTQQGGIVGAIGQALTIQFPLTEHGENYNQLQDKWVKRQVELGQLYKGHPKLQETGLHITAMLKLRLNAKGDGETAQKSKLALQKLVDLRREKIGVDDAQKFENIEEEIVALKAEVRELGEPYDDYLWATILGIATSIMLYVGRYGFIQAVSTVFVGMFTLITVATLIMLQISPEWAVTGSNLAEGMSFRVPPEIIGSDTTPIYTALAAFGIIGVGAMELITYPYWCLEKGYAKHTGPRDDSEAWAERARGWMRVMRFDAWLSMVVYTFATIAFYLLGAAVLWRTGLNPGGKDLIRSLSEMYVPVFGDWAPAVFLFGAFAVLYSTYFVAAAGNARTIADGIGLLGVTDGSERARLRWTKTISFIFPLLAVALFWIVGMVAKGQSPVAMVMAAGIGQGILLPMVGFGALWFRYRRCVDALRPGKLWDLMLWISFVGFVVVGIVTVYKHFS
ncbi:MAG: Nramp family divalent metal transporter [Pirellulales bacterium]